ncbi:MAG: hypothetical protein H7837_11250 [Magnetococcus sp. MYC-9]
MNEPVARYRLEVDSEPRREPFLLVAGEDLGSRPVQLHPLTVPFWSQQPGVYDRLLPLALRMSAPGLRRLRLYCSDRPESELRLVVLGGGQARCLGRRSAPVIETLTWLQSRSQSLRFFYDRPEVTILESTRFFDNNGQEVDPPRYQRHPPGEGLFLAGQPVTGALVVAYQASYFLCEIEYDAGTAVVAEKGLREAKLAWLAGNIRDATLPPVRVIALSGAQADQLTFARHFWPEHASASQSFQETGLPEATPVPGGYYVNPEQMSNCWLNCRERVKPGATLFTPQELQAIQECLQQSRRADDYQYMESKRETRTERIYSRNDPNNYVDVQRMVAVSFERQPINGGGCGEGGADNGLPILRLRFRNPSSPS